MASGATFHAKITADARQFIKQIEESTKALSGLVSATGKKATGAKGKQAENEVKSAYQEAQGMARKAHQEQLGFIRAENAARKQGLGAQFGGQGPAVRGARLVVGEYAKEQVAMEKQRRADLLRQRREEVDLQRQQVDAMVTGRYALYDMASAYQQVAYYAFQVTRALTQTVQKAAEFETAFTAVERAAVLEEGTLAFEYMRDALIDLSTEIPVAFAQISEIATLGAQMGVAASDLEGFTKTVAAFSAVTGASIDETAEKFGRISALAKVPVEEFENLASSVLFAGFNAVATEQEILSMSESIAAAAANAGYSAKQVVGLATALSSLGIAPEQARGVILRVFNTITRAIEGSTDKLEAFAAAAGVSAEEAQYLWKESPEQFFTSLLGGLGTVEQLTLALDELGITNTREINVIQRLSGNMDVYTKSLQEAATAYEEGSALQDIYAKTADNLEAKVTRLQNAFEALQAAGGEALAEVIKPVVEILIDATKAVTNFVQTPVGRLVIPMITGFAAVTAGMAGFRAVTTLATAQMLAMRTALLKMGQMGSLVQNPIRTLVATMTQQIFVTERLGNGVQFLTLKELDNMRAKGELTKATYNQIVANDAATVSTQRLGTAMRLLGAASVVAALVTTVGLFVEMAKTSAEIGKNVGGLKAYGNAVKQDTATFKESAAAITTFKSEVKKSSEATKNAADDSQYFVDAQGDIKESVEEATSAIEDQTMALGSNFKQLLLQDIVETDAFGYITEALSEAGTDLSEFMGGLGLTWEELISRLSDAPDSGIKIINDAIKEAAENSTNLSPAVAKLVHELNNMNTALSFTGTAYTELDRDSYYLKTDLYALASQIGSTVSATKSYVDLQRAMGLTGESAIESVAGLGDELEGLEDDASGAADALRTVLDYASDLSGIFQRVIDLEFSKIIGRDDIAKGWSKIADNADRAAEAIEKAAQTQKDLAADRTILEYQLSVAERYGDEVRAAEIRAKLSKVNSELAEADEELAEAQDKASMSLSGTSDAAIDNRAAILGSVKNYRDYIKTLAELGRSPEQLAGDIDVLKRQFREQALAAGYAESELAPYLDLFDQFAKVAATAPRDVDIEVALGLDAAEQAVNEFLAKKRTMGIDTEVEDPGESWSEIKARLEADHPKLFLDITPAEQEMIDFTKTPYRPNIVADRLATAEAGTYLRNWANAASNSLKITPEVWPKITSNWLNDYAQQHRTLAYKLGSSHPAYWGLIEDARTIDNARRSLGYADGGFVFGPGGPNSDSIPARLSNGEYVIQASAVSAYGVDFMNAINNQRVPMSTPMPMSTASSSGSTVAYLAPEDRALLRAVADRPVTLYADNTKIAQSANAGNQTLSQRGLK